MQQGSRDKNPRKQGHGTQRAKIAKKVHKPPLAVNVINFELNGFDASYGSPGVPQSRKRYNLIIEVFKFIRLQ